VIIFPIDDRVSQTTKVNADLLIINIGQLVTCASGGRAKRGSEMLDVGLISNAAIALKDGLFADVGTTNDIGSVWESDKVIDGRGRVVCPGFVDPHTHIVYAGDRLNEFELKIKGADYLEISGSGGGIISTVRNTRESSFDTLMEATLLRLDKMLECGTTTAEVKTGYGLNTETELKMLRVIERLDKAHPIDLIPTFLAAHTVPPEFKGNADGYVDLICGEMLPKAWAWYQTTHFVEQGTPLFADAFCEKNAFDLALTRRVLETAQGLGFRIKAHVDQFTNLGGSNFAIEANAASIDHLDAISDREIEGLSKSETVGIVIPTENFNAGKTQFANARRMIDAGCAVALSTDYNPGSAPCPSMAMAMAIACRYQKLLPAEALNAATVNASFGAGVGAIVGSIEVGKRADLLIVNTNDYRGLAYEFGGNQIKTVIKSGKVVIDERDRS
jgi:imidazolonepropionase